MAKGQPLRGPIARSRLTLKNIVKGILKLRKLSNETFTLTIPLTLSVSVETFLHL